MAVRAERAEVTAEEVIRELKKLGFSCIGKAVTWRNEVITQELDDGEEGEPKTVLVPRVTIVDTEDLDAPPAWRSMRDESPRECRAAS
jgi:hypothetical protein